MNKLFRNKQQILAEAKAKEEAQVVRKNFGGKIGETHLEITLRTDIPDEMERMLKLVWFVSLFSSSDRYVIVASKLLNGLMLMCAFQP